MMANQPKIISKRTGELKKPPNAFGLYCRDHPAEPDKNRKKGDYLRQMGEYWRDEPVEIRDWYAQKQSQLWADYWAEIKRSESGHVAAERGSKSFDFTMSSSESSDVMNVIRSIATEKENHHINTQISWEDLEELDQIFTVECHKEHSQDEDQKDWTKITPTFEVSGDFPWKEALESIGVEYFEC